MCLMEAATFAIVLVLLPLMVALYFDLGRKIESLGKRIEALNERLSARIDGLDARLSARIDALNERIDRILERERSTPR